MARNIELNRTTSATKYIFSALQNNGASSRKTTAKAALIEYSNNHKGETKTKKEIVDELVAKYGYNEYSILPDIYESSLNNNLPKLFKRINHGTYMCLGYDTTQTTTPLPLRSVIINLSEEEKEKIINLITEKFRNGFRVSSSIDFDRFKMFYAKKYGDEFQQDADWFNRFISSEAVIYDERAYIYNDDVVTFVRVHLEQMGSPCIFIEFFYDKFSGEFYELNIFSSDKLKAFIKFFFSDITVKWNYIIMQEGITPADQIKEVFGERETWTFDELQERLPCLKIDTIRQTINGEEYFRIAKGTYTHISHLDLPDNEGEKIIAFIEDKLQKRSYATANELDLSVFENLNHHCPFAAVRDAVFYKFLANNYNKSGQIITKKGSKLRVLDILEQYCRDAETVSFEELTTLEATFDPEGKTHSQCLIAGHHTMVRVSADLFVAESNVTFDTDKIDEVISLYCRDNFIPLRDIKDFSLLPYAGYSWNLFLLESYVRKFSHVFKYDVRAANNANIGVIIKKSFVYDEYDDVLTHALANSLVNLNDKKAVGNYLFDNGYIGRRNLGKNEESILKMAKSIREGAVH